MFLIAGAGVGIGSPEESGREANDYKHGYDKNNCQDYYQISLCDHTEFPFMKEPACQKRKEGSIATPRTSRECDTIPMYDIEYQYSGKRLKEA